MAVPSSAYYSEKFHNRESGYDGAYYICKYLSTYSTPAAAKKRFHLDRVFELRKHGSTYGFIGMTRIGGPNYKYRRAVTSSDTSTLFRDGNDSYVLHGGVMTLVCAGEGWVNNVGGAANHVYANRTTVNFTLEPPYYSRCKFDVTINGSNVLSTTLAAAGTTTRNANPSGAVSEGSTFNVLIRSEDQEYSVPVITNTFSRTVLPSITAITAMHLPSKNTMPEDSDWHSTAWIYSADLSALRSRCSNLSMGGEGTTTYPKGGEIVTNLDRTGILSEGYYAIDNNTGFRLISENGGVIYRAFRPMGKTGTWVVSLRAVPSTSPSGSYRYRVNVVMSYTYSGTKPNYDPPSVSLRNFRIRASRSSGGSNDQLAADWQSGSTISDTLSISASKTSDSSSYIYFNKGYSTVYIGLVSSGWTVVSNPSSLRISPGTDTAI